MKVIFIILILIITLIALDIWSTSRRTKVNPNIWSIDIEKETVNNSNWRTVLNTSKNAQLTVMSIPVGEELGWEVHHDSDQLFRTEKGKGVIWEAKKSPLENPQNNSFQRIDFSKNRFVFIPKGLHHNVVNNGDEPLKFYTIYSPPHHPFDRIDVTKEDEAEHFYA